jgi:hypothetical protein
LRSWGETCDDGIRAGDCRKSAWTVIPKPSLDSDDCGIVEDLPGPETLRVNPSVEDGSELIRVYFRGYAVADRRSVCATGGIGDVTMAGESPPSQLAG